MSKRIDGNIDWGQLKDVARQGDGDRGVTYGGGSTPPVTGNGGKWDAGGNWIDSGVSASTSGGPYDIIAGYVGKPGDAALVFLMTFTRPVSWLGNVAGSRGTVGVNPGATATFTIKQNASTIGTITVATGGAVTFATSGGAAVNFVAGDRLTITAPSPPDASLADTAFTMVGTR